MPATAPATATTATTATPTSSLSGIARSRANLRPFTAETAALYREKSHRTRLANNRLKAHIKALRLDALDPAITNYVDPERGDLLREQLARLRRASRGRMRPEVRIQLNAMILRYLDRLSGKTRGSEAPVDPAKADPGDPKILE